MRRTHCLRPPQPPASSLHPSTGKIAKPTFPEASYPRSQEGWGRLDGVHDISDSSEERLEAWRAAGMARVRHI